MEKLLVNQSTVCPKCGHNIGGHREHKDDSGERFGSSFWCDERMSYDNNDFCGCTHGSPPKSEETYTFYAVADRKDLSKARWYRTYSANRSSGYVDDLADAKIWVKRGVAKGKCTQLGPSATLVEFVVTKVNVIDNSEQFKKAAEKRQQEEVRRAAALKQMQIEQAKYDIQQASARLRMLQEKE
jgi:hypothetical protein